ncbi:hypothetical protein ACTOXX_11250 [Streptomyces rubiginosohelvolus]|uniref:hypothetical protein n=1 Tax=Streptomyces rubiginosohelvolus TaxID=67362 RepID=UPI00341E930C
MARPVGTGTDAGVSRERLRVVGVVLAVLVAAAAGFLAGGGFGTGTADAVRGLVVALAVGLLAAGATVGVWRVNRRHAARLGISTSRYLRVARSVRRGEAPDDPVERAAAADLVSRMRRGPGSVSHRWAPRLLIGGGVLWGVAGLVFIADDAYGWALYAFAMMGLVLVQLVSLRRRERRLEAAARGLGI